LDEIEGDATALAGGLVGVCVGVHFWRVSHSGAGKRRDRRGEQISGAKHRATPKPKLTRRRTSTKPIAIEARRTKTSREEGKRR